MRQPALERKILTVSALTAQIKDTLQQEFPLVLVSGEVSDVSRPASGHIYFGLKDAKAQIRAVLWRSMAARLTFDLREGQEVVCRGELDVYAPRGSYQLMVRHMEPLGLGDLRQRLKQLQKKLAAEGLFDARHKRPLPRLARRIALVTSPSGAAVRDFLEVARRRWTGAQIMIVPVRVQGDGAALEIGRAVGRLQQLAERPDVIVLARGGGSPEDLWCFNEEVLVRAVFASEIPVVSAIGHEVDVTLCDLAADVRALTPSEAAERVVPSAQDIVELLGQRSQRLAAGLRGAAQRARSRLESLSQRRVLRRPLEPLWDRARRLDELQQRAARAVRRQCDQAAGQLAAQAARLESLSPLGVLARGYSVTLDESQRLLPRAAALTAGQRMITRFQDGQAASRVERVELNQGDSHGQTAREEN